MKSRFFLTLFSVAASQAGPRTSTSYSIATDATSSGGNRATSTAYMNDGTVGGVVGISSVAAPAEAAKHGYVGQLYDVTGLTLTAATLSMNEGVTDQLTAWQALDDLSLLAVPAASVVWSVPSGPLTITAGGLATTGAVYQNTIATARGVYVGNTGTLGITVLNTLPDNFGNYASDGLDDDWQVQYFGLNNPNAAPLLDPDFDGHNNLFEFIAGLVPTDATSFFHLQIEPMAGFNMQKKILISPRFNDRTYTIKTSTSLLSNSWISLTGGTVSDNGTERTITDTNATQPLKFYRVEITKP